GLPEYLKAFPFVNGGLFEKAKKTPKFSRSSRAAILSSGNQDWSAINPDIFGSMFQAVISVDQRGSLGQHYTSVPNIMKVIEPLFLNELYEELENAGDNEKKLKALLNRIHNLKIFDPACGSGNFLIIAYKELRILEMKVFKAGGMMALSGIQLSQFYGIEIDDFAGEIAKLALWLAEHQMNVEFFKEFGRTNPTLPLTEAGKIVQGNACRLDWEVVCPKTKDDEIYILGNPPYLGARMQQDTHKADMDFVFSSFKNYRDLDYIAIWFFKAAHYIKGIDSKCAFVTTNSISQGLQVGLLWPNIFKLDIEIDFAHTSFKWVNNAKSNAGVTVAIIGLANSSKSIKRIFSNGMEKQVNGINAYLTDGGKTIIQRRSKPISNFNEMSFGNMPNDGGGLILSEEEKNTLLSENPEAEKYIKKLLGAQEFIHGQIRYCLWISDKEKVNAEKILPIKNCIEKTRQHRLNSKDIGTNKSAKRSHQFRDINLPDKNQIIITRVSSERRDYIPSGFLEIDTIISDSALAIYDAESWLFGILNSKMHMVWLRAVGGKLKTDLRYSKDVVYNTFPFPQISTQRKDEITQSVFRILEEREKHSDKTLAQLYDPDKMPEGLREAHRINDIIIERCYRSTPFTSDEERLEYLFKLYEKMILEEKEQGTLFAQEKKTRKKKK
ncbi:MAG: N-6 DNA methylase, partial [Bacteroidales bacterium]|nr:N-6 DNA methylase [Bacteroidales bacterium]